MNQARKAIKIPRELIVATVTAVCGGGRSNNSGGDGAKGVCIPWSVDMVESVAIKVMMVCLFVYPQNSTLAFVHEISQTDPA